MNTTHSSKLIAACLATIGLFAFITSAQAASIAFDAANDSEYDDGWQTGDNGGSGFGPWELTINPSNPSTGGHFIGDSANNGGAPSGHINTAGESFGLYANSGAISFTTRSFDGGPLAAGQTFSIDMDNGFIQDGGNVAFGLADDEFSASLTFGFLGGDTFYKVFDSAGTTSTTVPFTDDGLSIDITLGAANTYTLSVNNVIAATGTLDFPDPQYFILENFTAGSGGSNDAYFNSFAVTGTPIPEPGALALTGLAALGLVGVARRVSKSVLVT